MATISVNKTEVTITVGEQGPTGPMPVIVDGDGNIITYDDTAVRGLITGLTNNVSALTTQVANLVLNGGGSSGGGETFDPTSILASIATLDQRTTSNTTAIATVAASVPAPFNPAALQTSINNLNTRIDNLPAPYNPAPLNSRMTAAEAAILVAQARADNAFALATGTGEVSEYDDTQIRQLITANTQLIQALSTEIDGLPVTEQYDDTALLVRLDEIEASIPAPYNPTLLTNRIGAVETTVASLPRFSDIPNAFDPTSLSTRVGAVESTVSGLTTTVAALEQVEEYDDTQLTNRVIALESAFVNIPDEYDDSALTNRVAQNEALVATLPRFSDIPAPYNDAQINTRINEVEASIPEPYNDSGILSTLNGYNNRITYLENNGGGAGGGSVNEMIEGTRPNPFASARLGVLDGPTSRVFNNAFKQVWAWQGSNFSTQWAALVAGGHMTAGGQLISVMPGTNGFYTRAFFNAPQVSGASGRYRMRWDGICTIDINGAQNINRDIQNEIWFDFTANGSSWVDINVRTINSAEGNIRNISLVHQDDIESFDAGEIFRRQYIETVRNMRVLRFDEWIGILRSTNDGGLRIDTWASRPLPTDEMYSYRFVPYEVMANLCNTVGADMWVIMPTAATLDHFTQAATLIQSLIPEPRHVYVEYSTKTWDFAGTPQAHYTSGMGQADFATTDATAFRNWYGMQSTLMAQRWRTVWGANPRLHTVVQTQADWLGSEVDILIAPLWRDAAPARGLAPYVAPHSVVDMLTVHAQIDGGMAYGGRVTEIDNWRTTLSQTEAFNRMRNQMLTAQYFDDTTDNRNVDNLTIKWQYFKNVCNTYDLEFGIYEVGSHLNGVGGSAATQQFIQEYSVSAQMGEVYVATFNALRSVELDGPLCVSVEVRYPDSNIVHGLQRWLGDENLAWAAVNNLNQTLTGPTGRGAFDFVGSYELILGTGGGVVPPGTTYDDTVIVGRINNIETKLTEIEYLLRQIAEGNYTPAPIAPAQFGMNDWAVATGLEENQVVFSIATLPSDGGSAITALQYTINGGTTWTALSAITTGSYVVVMPAADALYNFQIRAVNAVDNGIASDTKSARSGAVIIEYPSLTTNMLRPGEIPVTYDTSLPFAQILASWFNGVFTTTNPEFVTFNDDDSVDLRAEYIGSNWNSGQTQIIKPAYGMGAWEWIASSTNPNAVLAMFIYDSETGPTQKSEVDWEYGILPSAQFGYPTGTRGFFLTIHMRRAGSPNTRSWGVGFVPYSNEDWLTPSTFRITLDETAVRWFIDGEMVAEGTKAQMLALYPDAVWVTNAKMDSICSVERHGAWAGPHPYTTASMKVWGVKVPTLAEQTYQTVAPSFTGTPTITGATAAGSILTANVGTTAGAPAPIPSFQWRVDGVNAGTGQTFVRPATGVVTCIFTLNNGRTPASQTVTAAATTVGIVYINNGTFNTDLSGWTFYAPRADYSARVQNNALGTRTAEGRMRITVATNAIYPYGQTTLNNLVVGNTYRVSIDKSGSTNAYTASVYNTGGANPTGLRVTRATIWQSGVQSIEFVATQTSHVLQLMVERETVGQFADYDNIIVTEIAVAVPVEPEEPVTAVRTASTSTDLKVHSGHSLVDTYINEGESFPGYLPELFQEQFGDNAWVFEGTDYKDTLPGSPMSVRWNDANDPRGAVLGISRYQTMVVTEGGPPFRLNAQNTAEYITGTLVYAMNFAENAYRNGDNGNGAESILWSIWPNVTGWLTNNPQVETQGANWRDLGGFRPVTVEYGRTFRYIADYVSWKMQQIHPELAGNYRMWMFPGHAWFVRVYDDIRAGLVPGMTSHLDLFRDDIHPNPTGSYALAVFMHTMLYQVDARPLTYRPSFVSAPLDAYFKRVAWEIANSEESVGMGGTANAAPVFIGGTTPDPMPTYSFAGETTDPETSNITFTATAEGFTYNAS